MCFFQTGVTHQSASCSQPSNLLRIGANGVRASSIEVIRPELNYEGSDLPVEASRGGHIDERVHQLRDPAIFQEGDKTYLLYSVAGESGIAIAEINFP